MLVVYGKKTQMIFTELSDISDRGMTATRKRCVMPPVFDHVSYEQAEDVNKCCTGYYVVYCLF